MNKNYLLAAMIILTTGLTACKTSDDGIPQFESDFVGTDDPDHFLKFLNTQSGLTAGDYTIVAGTASSGLSGNFSIIVKYDDSSTKNFSGSWSHSGGPDEASIANPHFSFTQTEPGGIQISITSTISTCLYLLDRGGSVLAGIHGIDLCANPNSISLPSSLIDSADNAAAYYQAIDPNSTRDTLQKWKQANHFGETCGSINPCEAHVIFRDAKDLGYGRSMYARRNDGGSVAIYVENFQVDAVPGSQGYTQMNLEAAIKNQRRWHFGSNAIEFSAYPYGENEPKATPNARMFAKFYTFTPENRTDPNTTENRALMVDLDERGEKSMPGPCITCHGGKSIPLLNGELPPSLPGGLAGDLLAKMQAIEVDTLEFSSETGYTQTDLESGVRFINQAVLSTYQIIKQQNDAQRPAPSTPMGYWNPDFAALTLKGWYGGNIDDPNDFTLPNNSFNNNFVPRGWQPDTTDGNPPPGADELYKKVVGPYCLVCHSKRGTELQDDIGFTSYAKFIAHADQIEAFVFDRGLMPLSLLNFDTFWDHPERAPLLGSFLPGFSHGNPDGTTRQPGKPIAVIAAPRRTKTPITLSGSDSAFATGWQWRIAHSPTGSHPTLTSANMSRPVFDTDMDGDYTLEMTASNGTQLSSVATVAITVANSDPALITPRSIRFATNIRAVLQSNPPDADCDSCHADPLTAATPRFGIPVYYTDAQSENRVLYNEVRARINFKAPLDSLLLRKPSNHHHNGGLRPGFDLEGDRSHYDLFLTWILEGAVQ